MFAVDEHLSMEVHQGASVSWKFLAEAAENVRRFCCPWVD